MKKVWPPVKAWLKTANPAIFCLGVLWASVVGVMADQPMATFIGAVIGFLICAGITIALLFWIRHKANREDAEIDKKFVEGVRVVFDTLESNDPETIAVHGTRAIFIGRKDHFRCRVRTEDEGAMVLIPYDFIKLVPKKENDAEAPRLGSKDPV